MLSHLRKPLVSTVSSLTSRRHLSFVGLSRSVENNRQKILCPTSWRSQLANARQIESSTRQSEEVPKLLLETLTPDFCEQLAGKSTSKKFKLKSIEKDLDNLYGKGFPLPNSLTEEQWRNLMEFNTRIMRVHYLDSIVEGIDRLEELRQKDASLIGPLQVPETLLMNADEERKAKIKMIQLEHERLRQVGEQILPTYSQDEWQSLLSAPGCRQIIQTLRYFVKKKELKLNKRIEKQALQIKKAIFHEEAIKKKKEEKDHIVYGLGNNTIFLRMYNSKLDSVNIAKLISNYNNWGQPIVIDMAFVKMLSFHEVQSLCFRELPFGINMNKASKEPLPMYITNFNPDCPKCRILKKAYSNLLEPNFPAVVTNKSYLDMFPTERLVYMTPDSRTDMLEYNPDDIYIVGGIVQLGDDTPYTLSTAKKQGIRHARFPIKRTVGISPILNVDHAISIIVDFAHTKDWFYSFRWIPPRFFKNRLKVPNYTSELEQIFVAQHTLNPNTHPKLLNLSPKEYRARYSEIMKQADNSDNFVADPNKYLFHGKLDRERRLYGVLGELM